MKTCRDCKTEKGLGEFLKAASNRDGISNQCKACRVVYRKEFRARNRERILAAKRAYYAANRERVRATAKQAYAENKAPTQMRNNAWRVANRERIQAYQAEWNKRNPERLSQYRRGIKDRTTPQQRKEKATTYRRHSCSRLSDGYVRRLLCWNCGIQAAQIPDSLVGAKRAQLQLARKVRQLGRQHENEKSYGGTQ